MNKLIILLAVVFLGISACGGGGNGGGGDGGDTEPNRDVYVAGYTYDGSKQVAAYWKNGEEIRLDSGDVSAEAKSIYVTDSDVHVVGRSESIVSSESSTVTTFTAKYWLNGTEITLDNGTGTGTFPPSSDTADTYASADSVFVSGDDVYIAGAGGHNDVTTAKYWKNEAENNLGDGDSGSLALSVFVSEGVVYAAGEANDEGGFYRAAYWVDGVPKYVADISLYSLYVSGTDVYLTGIGYNNGLPVAAYWKDDVFTFLSNEESAAFSIFVFGSDVYVAGHKDVCIESDDDTGNCVIRESMAVYWKNGAEIELTGGVGISYAKSIVVSGKDVYVAGYVYDGTKLTAAYWKNGTMIPLSDTESAAHAIFVK